MRAGVNVAIDHTIVEAGGLVTGTLWWHTADEAANSPAVRGALVSLLYATHGQGSRDTADVSQAFESDERGDLNATFALPVPRHGPISYTGRLLEVRWSLRVRTDKKRAIDPTYEYKIVVVPRNGLGRYGGPHPLRQ